MGLDGMQGIEGVAEMEQRPLGWSLTLTRILTLPLPLPLTLTLTLLLTVTLIGGLSDCVGI